MAEAPQACCVDGTNVVRGSFGYGGPDFRDQEDADSRRLIEALAQLCEGLAGSLEMEVFFDGAPGSRERASGGPENLRVSFARELAADDMILDRVRGRRYAGGRVTVVTGDGELGRRVSEEGARWLKVRPGTRMEAVVRSIERRFIR